MPRPVAPIPPHADLIKLYRAALGNAQDLVDDAKLLAEHGRYPRAYALATLAWEELSKAQWCIYNIANPSLQAKQFWDVFTTHIDKLGIGHTIKDVTDLFLISPPDAMNKSASSNKQKERLLYVDYKRGRILVPTVKSQRTISYIKRVDRLISQQRSHFEKLDNRSILILLNIVSNFTITASEQIEAAVSTGNPSELQTLVANTFPLDYLLQQLTLDSGSSDDSDQI